MSQASGQPSAVQFQADLETPGAGHGFAYYETMAEMAIRLLVEPLDENARRLV